MELSAISSKFTSLGINVATITYDRHEDALKFHRQYDLQFPILRDVDAKHVIAFGILNENYEPGHRAYGIPHPGIFLVDSSGAVYAKFAEQDYRDRPSLEEVLLAANKMVSAKSRE